MKNDLIEKIYNEISFFSVKKTHFSKRNQELSFKLKDSNNIRDIAKRIKEFNGRCITIDVYKKQDDYILLYHFDIKNILITIEVFLTNKTINSISSVLKSAIWIEQGINQKYPIKFSDHRNMEKIFLNKDILKDYLTLSELMTKKIKKVKL